MWVIIKIVMHEYSISEGCIRLCGNCRNVYVGRSLAMLRTACINNYLDISDWESYHIYTTLTVCSLLVSLSYMRGT